MIETNAKKLIQQYIDGWKTNDREKILSTLVDDCEVIESHGPVYRGLQDVRDWIDGWIKNTWQVNVWEIRYFYFTEQTAIFEWHFEYSSATEKPQTIDGISIAKFNDEKISYLREYRMTQELFVSSKNYLCEDARVVVGAQHVVSLSNGKQQK